MRIWLTATLVNSLLATSALATASAPGLGAHADQPAQLDAPVVEVTAKQVEAEGLAKLPTPLAATLEAALCNCCCNASCIGMRAIDRDLCGGRVGYAGSIFAGWAGGGTIAGVVVGAVLGLIPAVLFAGVAYSASVGNGATAGDALNAGFYSFSGTWLLSMLLVGVLGLLVGSAVGVVHALVEFATFRSPRRARSRRARSRGVRQEQPPRRRTYDDEYTEYDDEYEEEGDGRAGDAPPPLALRY